MLVVKYPQLHRKLFAGIKNQPHVGEPILTAKFLVSTRLYADRAYAAVVDTVKLLYNEAVVLVVKPQERGNIVSAVPVNNFC